MLDKTTTVQELKDLVGAFVEERNWNQFHSPKNLSMSIAIEAAELMELFQWSEPITLLEESQEDRLREELADVVIYCLSLANAAGIDLAAAVRDKVAVNADKYPVERCLGRYK